jgi:surface glycoprotein (TIGR04207 family)
MSGNIGEKARAAFLALIMVTSVMAAGVAFSGSAAALEDPKTDDDGNPVSGAAGGLVVADPANPGDNTVHNASVELASSSALTGDSANDPSSLQNITINYSQADVDFDLEDPGSTGASQNNISDITVTIDRNSVDLSTLENTKGDDAAVQIDNANDQIFVDFGFNDNSISLPETNSTGQPDISPGSKIFVEIDGPSTDGSLASVIRAQRARLRR